MFISRLREETEPPENQLQKAMEHSPRESRLSEHELRFRKSTEKLTVPDWYKIIVVHFQLFPLGIEKTDQLPVLQIWTAHCHDCHTECLTSMLESCPI